MEKLTTGKLAQAGAIVAASGADLWIVFDRETAGRGDPVLPLLYEGGLTWQSALILTAAGRRIAIVGNFDADPVRATGDWEVVPYVQGIQEPLLRVLAEAVPGQTRCAVIAVDYSRHDDKADGLSHGMFLLLEDYLRGTSFEGCLISAENIVGELRSRKIPAEIERMRGAISETERLFSDLGGFARPGRSEQDLYRFLQERIDERGFGYSWDRAGNPIVNVGPDSMIGHGVASPALQLAPGLILHVDLGILRDGYASDLQRCWWMGDPGGIPASVRAALDAVNGAITAAAAVLRPGVEGWQVDEAARTFIREAGYPEYQHAVGHQVGRMAHDGGSVLGPKWERYGRTVTTPILKDQVYTLELGVLVPAHGFIGIEEMVQVGDDGCAWLSERQLEMRVLPA